MTLCTSRKFSRPLTRHFSRENSHRSCIVYHDNVSVVLAETCGNNPPWVDVDTCQWIPATQKLCTTQKPIKNDNFLMESKESRGNSPKTMKVLQHFARIWKPRYIKFHREHNSAEKDAVYPNFKNTTTILMRKGHTVGRYPTLPRAYPSTPFTRHRFRAMIL